MTMLAAPEQRTRAAAAIVTSVSDEIEPLARDYHEAVWRASLEGRDEDVHESARLDAKIRTIYARPEPYRTLHDVEAAGGVGEPLLARQVRLLGDLFRAHQIPVATIERMVRMEKELERRFNSFRAELDGERVTDNALRQVLTESNDGAARRRAWEASKQVGAEVVDDLRELVRVRNQAARGLEYENYYTMMLELDELEEGELFAVLDELEHGTRPLFADYKRDLDARLAARFGVAPAELRPWHYGDPFFQEAPAAEIDLDPFFVALDPVELTRRFFGEIGFDLDDLLRRADLYEKPGKSQHAFCLSVDRLDDIRVLCNVQANEYWTGVMLHEFGHAIYDQAIDRSLPFTLRTPAHTLTTEASAMLFGRLSKNGAWLRRYAGIHDEVATRAAEAMARAIRGQLTVQTRWCLVMCHMERELYRDPEQDLDALWWDLVERFQNVPRPEGRRAPDWASKIHFSVAPVYYHNYMLGEMMASQLQAHILRDVLGGAGWDAYVSSPKVGEYLRRSLYAPGRSIDWREAITNATGRPLSPAPFVAELAGRA